MARTARIGPVTRETVVLAFWHEYNLALYAIASARRGDLGHASFTTDTDRGTVIQTIFESLARRPGQVVILRLPDEGQAAQSRALARRLGELGASGYSVVVTPDGPWGPYRVAKPGVLIVARQSGLPVVPVAVRARPAIRLARRWDRQLLPLPFSRLTLVTGSPMTISRDQPLRPLVPAVQAALDAVTATAEGRLP
ncbi:MAG TPA: hypothetical protein VGO32_03855 [Candidatus Limnocylindria bacterium]|nr:hypothetical protein [Candidatus Limnocylindria bacterium]